MYKTIKAKSVVPGKHTVRVQFPASGREADCVAKAKRTRNGQPEVRVERFGWLTFDKDAKVQVVK